MFFAVNGHKGSLRSENSDRPLPLTHQLRSHLTPYDPVPTAKSVNILSFFVAQNKNPTALADTSILELQALFRPAR